ncbi:DNA repair protein RAD51 [Coccidioides immitis H538.4]|uniref:DNA repair protein RAD51 n=1 Tax=Coccidioides immitis H538.4 TaxID=396776 RepID=A0A0J8RTB6_COCIT|nr:DNA repair protein RAD51 [Coccidioides immitis H538.4]
MDLRRVMTLSGVLDCWLLDIEKESECSNIKKCCCLVVPVTSVATSATMLVCIWLYGFAIGKQPAKQCYHCQGLGHVQADCPTLRLNGGATSGRCYNCNLPGHLARNCHNAGMQGAPRNVGGARGGFNAPFRGGYGGYPRAATCYKCGGPNHFARDCQAQAMKCYACGKLGHISRDCTAPNGGPLSSAGKVCYKCSQAGHISRDCPTNNTANTTTETNTQPTAETTAPAPPATETTTEAPQAPAAATTPAVA